jgi:hypothetical protein
LSTPKTTYEVDTEERHCTCPAYKHSRNKRWCKHLTFVTTRPGYYESEEDCGEPEQTLSEAVPGLYTLGHSNHSIEDFIALLERYQIRAVIDVRSAPYSRFSPHFSREKLRALIRAEGIDYFWAGKELGGRGKIPVTSAAFLGRMKQVEEMVSRSRVALMCSEGDPADCHRGMKLTAWMHRNTEVIAQHIRRDGTTVESGHFETEMGGEWLWVDYGGKRGQ